jgi:hypothetical protein
VRVSFFKDQTSGSTPLFSVKSRCAAAGREPAFAPIENQALRSDAQPRLRLTRPHMAIFGENPRNCVGITAFQLIN